MQDDDLPFPASGRRAEALGELAEVLRRMLDALLTLVLMALPWLLKLACAGLGIGTALYLFNAAWSAFGGDPAAFIPAFVLAACPLGAGVQMSYGGMFAAGLVNLGLIWLLSQISPFVRDVIVIAVIASVILFEAKRSTQ